MEQLNFDYNHVSLYKTVFTSVFAHEETAELIVPDAQPDILRFVETGAVALMRSKEGERGQVRVTGVTDVCVTYLPDGGGGVRKLETSIPFSAQAESPDITQDCLICARVSVAGTETRMINPRKILIRVNLTVDVMCCAAQELRIASDAQNAENAAAELLNGECSAQMLTELTEKTFLISDDLSVPALKSPSAELLRQGYTLNTGEFSVVGSRIIVKGEVVLELLYRPEGGGLACFEHTIPYSQIVDFELPCEDSVFDVWPMLTGAYLSPDDSEPGRFAVELHAVVQCARYTRQRIDYVADAYSTKYALDCAQEKHTLRSLDSCSTVSAMIKGTVPAAAPVGSVISVNVFLAQPAAEQTEGQRGITVPANVVMIYETEDGRLLSAVQKLACTLPLEGDAESVLMFSAAWSGEYHTSVTASGVDVRIPVALTVRRFSFCRFAAIETASYDPEKPLDCAGRPSVVLRRIGDGDTVWQLAKKYCSTRELILQSNGLESETDVCAGNMLLSPRRR